MAALPTRPTPPQLLLTEGAATQTEAMLIPKEFVWDVCMPYFEKMVDAVFSTVQSNLEQGGKTTQIAPKAEEQPRLLGAIGKPGRGALRWSFLRQHKYEIFKLKCEPVVEEAPCASGTDSSPSSESIPGSPLPADEGEPSPAESGQFEQPGVVPPPSLPLASTQITKESRASRRAGWRRRGAESKSAPNAHSKPDKADVVCCHWKNKGWCKYFSGMVPGKSCKFAHPMHKQGIGQTLQCTQATPQNVSLMPEALTIGSWQIPQIAQRPQTFMLAPLI